MPDEVINLIMGQSILYANQKNCTHFSPNQDKLKAYLAILVLYGYQKLPQEDMYWVQSADAGLPMV
jgi:hypothetical protein